MTADPPAHRTVLAWMVQRYLAFAVKIGLSPEALCAAAGIREAQVAAGDAYVPYRWLWKIREEIIRQRPDTPLGLELGRFLSADQYGYMGQAIKHAATPRAAIGLWNELIVVVHRGIGPGEPCMREIDGISHWEMPSLPEEPSVSFEALFVGAVLGFRALTGEHVCPREVRFERCRPEHLPALSALFDAPVSTGNPSNVLSFESKVLDLPIRQSDRGAQQNFRAQFERSASHSGDPFCTAVQQAIEAELLAGRLSQPRVAKLFGMTPRTLQRKCRERGVRYQHLVMRARRTAALRLLENRALNIHEVALAVGYDASSFNRVFRSWTGMSPSVFRKAGGPEQARA